jgi:hypothetical protein
MNVRCQFVQERDCGVEERGGWERGRELVGTGGKRKVLQQRQIYAIYVFASNNINNYFPSPPSPIFLLRYNFAKAIFSGVAVSLSRVLRATNDKLVLPSNPPSTAFTKYGIVLD